MFKHKFDFCEISKDITICKYDLIQKVQNLAFCHSHTLFIGVEPNKY